MSERRPGKWLLLAATFLSVVAADQATKFFAVDRLTRVFEMRGAEGLLAKLRGFYRFEDLEPYRKAPYAVWESFWHMKYVENPGAAWGAFQGLPDSARNWFFIVVSVGAIAFILYYYRKLTPEQRYLQLALALVLGGAVGNFIDRLARHYVIDFVDWHWLDKASLHWPTFNLADAAICVGVAMLIIDPTKKKKEAPVPLAPPSPGGNKDAATGL